MMDYKINPDAKYMMYDKPYKPTGILNKIVNSDNFKLMRDAVNMAIIENEMEIDALKNEIRMVTGCKESLLKGFSVIQLEMIKEKILEGYHYENVIGAMRFLHIDIDK